MEAASRLEGGPLVVPQHRGALPFIRGHSWPPVGLPPIPRDSLLPRRQQGNVLMIHTSQSLLREYSSLSFWHTNGNY